MHACWMLVEKKRNFQFESKIHYYYNSDHHFHHKLCNFGECIIHYTTERVLFVFDIKYKNFTENIWVLSNSINFILSVQILCLSLDIHRTYIPYTKI